MRRALLLLALAGPASAETGPHKEGAYGGVVPGQKPEPSGRPGKPAKPPPKGTLSWVGFEAKDGGAQVFFQSVAPFEVQQHLEGSTLVVHLSLTRLGPNAWRQIDTRFFDNPLSGIVARAVGATRASKTRPARGPGIDVRISFKNPKDARQGTLRTATEADGMFYAYLSFPEGADAAPKSKLSDPEEVRRGAARQRAPARAERSVDSSCSPLNDSRARPSGPSTSRYGTALMSYFDRTLPDRIDERRRGVLRAIGHRRGLLLRADDEDGDDVRVLGAGGGLRDRQLLEAVAARRAREDDERRLALERARIEGGVGRRRECQRRGDVAAGEVLLAGTGERDRCEEQQLNRGAR